MKTFVVSCKDGWNPPRFIQAKTPRKACVAFLEKYFGLTNPRLGKVYVDRKDGVYHVGYVNANHWLSVGEYIPFEVKQ